MRLDVARQFRVWVACALCTLVSSAASSPEQRLFPQLFGIPGLPVLALRSDFNGIDPQNISPDLAIAVGHSSIVMVRNNTIVIREKTGRLIASTDLSAFFNPVRSTGGGVGDPNVLYDPSTDRFFVITEWRSSNPISYYFLAVSRTPSPADLRSSSWYFYSLNRSLDNNVITNNWGDFDHMTVTDDVLIITCRPITAWTDLRDNAFGGSPGELLPAIQQQQKDGVFLVNATASCAIQIWRITNARSSGVPTINTASVRDTITGGCSGGLDAVQAGGQPIDVGGAGFNAQPVYRNGSLWVARNISTMFGGKVIDAIYVAEIDVSRWPDSVRIIQRAVIADDNVWQYDPAIIVDSANNVAIVYARSSPTEFPSTYYAGRLASDPTGTFRTARLLKNGETAVDQVLSGRNRFLDYTGAALDPSDDSIWLFGLYAKTPTTSGSWVGNIDMHGQAMLESRIRVH
jgi:hypothetical protein